MDDKRNRCRNRLRIVAGCFALLSLYACRSMPDGQALDVIIARDVAARDLDLKPLVVGLERPVGVVDSGDTDKSLLIVTQVGRILRWSPQGTLSTFLDLGDRVSCCGERGLLGLALHPDYRRNGRLFVYYTDSDSDSRIVEFERGIDGTSADPASGRELLYVEQPTRVHNGGQLQFGPDGFLYVALGDGGHFADHGPDDRDTALNDPTGRDPLGHAQNPASLLGKILRLDVDSAHPYGIPADNPRLTGGRPEVWALGLRNPWRFSFDRYSGALFIADVGLEGREEVNFQSAGSGGANYGWPLMEGSLCENPGGCGAELVRPIIEYSHRQGCAIIGGYRYRGNAIRALDSRYLYADYCNGEVYSAAEQADGWSSQRLLQTRLNISAFGETREGELLLVDIGGGLYQLTPRNDR